jgi:hypothetical protein
MAALKDQTHWSERKQVIGWLEEILGQDFFGVIKRYCGKNVKKYWITGVLPAFRNDISPLIALEMLSLDEKYQSLCGFTQEDVDAIVTRTVPKDHRDSTLQSLKRWFNGYQFSPTLPGSKNIHLYNPQLVFGHLRKFVPGSPPPSPIDEANTVHSAAVLSIVSEDGPVTITDLIGMLLSKTEARILKELSFIDSMQKREKREADVTWSLLYYLGLVTFHKDVGSEEGLYSLCAPNSTMTHLVSPGISCLGECCY